MRDKLPLFPLGTVLFPGMLLPLHVFEDRYRQMVRDLLARPEPRDGRFDLVTVGAQRFRLLRVDPALPYLQGEIEPLPDDEPDAAAAPAVRAPAAACREHLDALTERAGATVRVADLPGSPALLSFIVAAAMVIDRPERQRLLAESDVLSRLNAERALLSRETGMLRRTTTRPAPGLRYAPYSPN